MLQADRTTPSRPKKVDEVAHQDEVTRTLAKSIETGNVLFFTFLVSIQFIKLFNSYSCLIYYFMVPQVRGKQVQSLLLLANSMDLKI